jgi:hypothetical protein
MAVFKTLFEINLKHDYFPDLKLKDLVILPTEETARIIKNRKLMFRNIESGFKVSFRAYNDAPLVSVNDVTFNFLLFVKNPAEFYNYSNLRTSGKLPASNSVLFFRNDPVNKKKLAYSILDGIKPHIFDYTFPFQAEDPANDEADFEIEDHHGHNIITVEDIACDNLGIYRYRIDLSGQPSGRYTFKSSDENHDVVSQEIYIDNALYKQRPSGLIQIKYEENTRADYSLKFKRSTSKWLYRVVNKSGISLDDYDLQILDESGDDGSETYSSYLFNGSQSPDEDNNINGYEVLVFVSNKKIPFYEIPKVGLKLKKVDVTVLPHAAEVMIKNMPNPDLGGILNDKKQSEIMVFI